MDSENRTYLAAVEQEHAEIQELVNQGILSRELLPDPHYWHWHILKPADLPEKFSMFLKLGEVRWPGYSGHY